MLAVRQLLVVWVLVVVVVVFAIVAQRCFQHRQHQIIGGGGGSGGGYAERPILAERTRIGGLRLEVGHLVDIAVRIVADAIIVRLLVLLQANVVRLPEERLLFASVHGES